MIRSSSSRFTTADQKLYYDGDHLTAEIEVGITHERVTGYPHPPSIAQCRHAVLEVRSVDPHGNLISGYVTYDRLLCRIVNGVYYSLEGALKSAQAYNEYAGSPQDMSPNGLALGLRYPEVRKEKNAQFVIADRRQER